MKKLEISVISILISSSLILPSKAISKEIFGKELTGTIGLGEMYSPTYKGSDDSETGAGLDIDIRWGDLMFFNENGIGAYIIQPPKDEDGHSDDGLRIGLGLGYDADERLSKDDKRLLGLDDVDSSAEINLSVEYEIGMADLEIELSRALGSSGHEGTTIETSLEFDFPIGERSFASISPFVTWGDKNYNSAFYGVSSREASSSIYNQYKADSGLERYGLKLQTGTMFTKNIGVASVVEYSSLSGDAADSPIVIDKNQLEFSLGLIYNF